MGTVHRTILLTGAQGLIGTRLAARLKSAGNAVIPVDIRTAPPGQALDLRDHAATAALVAGVDGIVHLGAVSRVVDGQNDPVNCHAVNVEATQNLLAAALAAPRRPWLLYSSSREVYGQQDIMPVGEDAPFRPLNVYARTKIAAENLCEEARDAGLGVAIVRFSSVYGSPDDHPTRVVPAFLRAGLAGGELRVEGAEHAFDLTHVDDVAGGVMSLIGLLETGVKDLPPIHFAGGIATPLLALAEHAVALGGNRARISIVAPRTYDIHRFVGTTDRAAALLGWTATTPLEEGLKRLAADLAARYAGSLA